MVASKEEQISTLRQKLTDSENENEKLRSKVYVLSFEASSTKASSTRA